MSDQYPDLRTVDFTIEEVVTVSPETEAKLANFFSNVERKGTHKCEVVPVVMEPHPNADSLSIVRVFGFTVCVRTADWVGVEKAAYIQPDSVVPDNEQFAFLKKTPEDTRSLRIKVKKLRGVISMGMLVPAPEGSQIGDDVADVLGITHYEPPEEGAQGSPRGPGLYAETPNFFIPKYDLESLYRYKSMFVPGEPVYGTEKLHGQQARFMFDGERMWAGSKGEWKKPNNAVEDNWWTTVRNVPWIEDWCRRNPKMFLFGEIFGWVQDLKYGAQPGQLFFRAFDIQRPDATFLDASDFRQELDAKQRVPEVVVDFPFDFEALCETSNKLKSSILPSQLAEGIVVRPMRERVDLRLGRTALKIVSATYLERA